MLLTPAYLLQELVTFINKSVWRQSLRRSFRSVFSAFCQMLKSVELKADLPKMPENMAGYTLVDFKNQRNLVKSTTMAPPTTINRPLSSSSSSSSKRYFDRNHSNQSKMQHLEVESFLYFDLHDLKNNFVGHPKQKVAPTSHHHPSVYTHPKRTTTTKNAKEIKDIMNRYLGPAKQVSEKTFDCVKVTGLNLDSTKDFMKAEKTETPFFHHTTTISRSFVTTKAEIRKTSDYTGNLKGKIPPLYHDRTSLNKPLYHHTTTAANSPYDNASSERTRNYLKATRLETSLYHHATTIEKPLIRHRAVKKDVRDLMNRYLKPELKIEDDDDDGDHRRLFDWKSKASKTNFEKPSRDVRPSNKLKLWDEDSRIMKRRKSSGILDIMNHYLGPEEEVHERALDYVKSGGSEIADIMSQYLGSSEHRVRERTVDRDDSKISELMNRYLGGTVDRVLRLREPPQDFVCNARNPGIANIMNRYLSPQDQRQSTTTSTTSYKFAHKHPTISFDSEIKSIMEGLKQRKVAKQSNLRYIVDPQVEEIMSRYLSISDLPYNYGLRRQDLNPEIDIIMDRYLNLNKNGEFGIRRDFGISRMQGLSAYARRQSIKGLMNKYLPNKLGDDDSYFTHRAELDMPILTKTSHYSFSTYRPKGRLSVSSESRLSSVPEEDNNFQLPSYNYNKNRLQLPERRPSILDDDVFEYDLNSRVEKDKNRSGDPLWQIMARYLDDVNLDHVESGGRVKRMFSSSTDSGLGWMESEDGTTTGISRESSVEDLTRIAPPPRKRLTHPPFFSMPLRRRNIIEGDTARLVCNVQGFPEPKITWSKNGLPVHSGEYYKIVNRWGTASLEIASTAMRDTGTYRCHAINDDGEESTACELVVEEKLAPDETIDYIRPSFVRTLHKIRIREGKTARFELIVSGHPEPEVQWYHDNNPIEESERIKIEKYGAGAITLVVNSATVTDGGRYKAVASSPAGKASCAAELTVLELEADVESEGEIEPGHRRRHRKQVRKPRDKKEKKKKKKKEPKPPKASFEGRMRRRFQEEYGIAPSKDMKGRWESARYTPPSYLKDRDTPTSRFSPGSPFRPTPSIFKPSPVMGRRGEQFSYDAYSRRERSYRYEEEEQEEITRGKKDALFTEQIDRLSRMDFHSLEAEEMEEISISEDIKVDKHGKERVTRPKVSRKEAARPPREEYEKVRKVEKKVEKKMKEEEVKIEKKEEVKAEEVPTAIINDVEGEGPPIFVRGLTEQIVKDGDKVILEVEISGARPMDVGWLRNGHDIPDSEEFRYVTRGTVHQLEIAEIFPEDSGKYTCEALNDHGEADSSAMINVLEEPSGSMSLSVSMTGTSITEQATGATIEDEHIPPEFFEEPVSTTVEEGGCGKFVCDVDGEPIPSVKWIRDGKEITAGGRYKIYCDKYSHTFEIEPVTAADAGPYLCLAWNNEGEVKCEVTLTVTKKEDAAADKAAVKDKAEAAKPKTPKDESKPKPATPKTKDKPKPEPKKVEEPKKVPEPKKTEEAKKPEDAKKKEEAKKTEETKKTEEAKKKPEEAKKKPEEDKKTTGGKPNFSQPLKDVEGNPGKAARFECVVKGEPTPDIKWYKDGKLLKKTFRFQMSTSKDGTCIFEIPKAMASDAGEYECRAENKAGTQSSKAKLSFTAAGKPFGKPGLSKKPPPGPGPKKVGGSIFDKMSKFGK